jgi:peptidoglycan/LPS O-acetylase OafA/YrhL
MLTNKSNKLTWNIISEYRGVLMGIAIISILIFHYTDDCRIYDINFNGWVEFYNLYISSSWVDVFLFLSGFGLYFALKKKSDITSFYVRRFVKIIVPYLLVAIPTFLWRDFYVGQLGVSVFIKDLFFVTLFSKGNTWYWYVFMICFCYFIFPYVFQVVETCENEIAEQMRMMGIFTFFTVIAIMLQLYYKDFFGNINIFLLRFPVFFLGTFIGKRAYEKREISWNVYVMMILSLIIVRLRLVKKVIIVRYVVAFLNLSICFAIAIIFNKLKSCDRIHKICKSFFEWFGAYSLELYLTHVTVRSIMNHYGYFTYHAKNELIMVCISIILSLVLKKVTEMLVKLVHYSNSVHNN